ncbi:MAG: histidinol-phosphate transaminase [Candidatus Omnitrophica bacterium CG11_big_fil_rev_8_21_14_0_20_64_10]|nr:MAG: histidinol-phosphate transaminase [Candidatus Omnitrophica bacterium CG11_big_fil_rev_8_21_14_0_20_64_10]
MGPEPRRALSEIRPYRPGKPIEEVERELGISGAVKLASNENPLGPSPKALEAIRRALPNLHRYPESGAPRLTGKLAARLQVGPEQLILGNGSDELITLAVRAFVEPGDEVIVADPTFLIYGIAARIAGARVRVVPSRDFRYDLEGMAGAFSPRTRIVFIANPDNPTGTFVTRAELERFLQRCPDRVLVFLDEAYAELVDAPDYPDGLTHVGKKPVFVTRTFSKAYGLAGLRVGYGVGAPEIVAALQKVREPFNVNSLAQAAAEAALDDAEFLERTRALLREEKGKIQAALKRLNLPAVPSAANFILFQAGPDAAGLMERLLRRGVIVRGMTAWGLSEHVRVTVGLPEENLRFIEALTAALNR